MPQEFNIALTAMSQIKQDDQSEVIETITNGTITEMPKASYVRYVEETAVDDTTLETNVAIKLAHDNTLQIRRSGTANALLTFDLNQTTTTHYRTAVGNFVFNIDTQALSIDTENGTCHVAYTLKNGEDLIGSYDFKLNYRRI